MDAVVAVIIFLGITIAGALITKLFDDPITWLLARVFGGMGPRRTVGIRGTWRSTYEYQSPDGRRQVQQVVELRQFGPYVMGKAVATNWHHKHRVRARFKDRVLTGVWENVSDGAQHIGAFQLLLRPDGDVMTGKWVGFDRRNRVQQGDWQWELLTRAVGKRATSKVSVDAPTARRGTTPSSPSPRSPPV